MARVLCASVLVLAGCVGARPPADSPPPPAAPAAPAERISLTLVGTNDTHGWVHPHTAVRDDGTEVEEGGAATFAGYLAILRAENPGGVLLLDGGDLFQGTLASNLSEGKVVLEAFNRLGYTATALGNHEFDYGPVGAASTPQSPGDDPFGALRARIAEAKFPMLAANVLTADGHRPDWLPGDGTLLLTVKGVKVGIVGLVTPHTPTTTNPVNVVSLRFGPLAPTLLASANRLRAAGAEVVVAIMHAGGKCGSLGNPRDLASCDPGDGEIFSMMQELPAGTVDAVIAGHTHQPLGHFIEGVPVIETSGLGRSFGVIRLAVDPATRKVVPAETSLRAAIPICARIDARLRQCDVRKLREAKELELVPATFLGKPVEKDAALEAALRPALEHVREVQGQKLGVVVKGRLWRNYEAESALGSALADSLRRMEKADVALLNAGGLRADLKDGELTYGDVYEVLPFDNTVAGLRLSGAQLGELLRAAYSGRKGVFQVSGLQIRLGQCGGRARLQSYTLADGTPVDPKKTYRVALPDFLVRGGDGLGGMVRQLSPEQIELGEARPLNFRDAMVAHWQREERELRPPKLGRIQFVPGGAECKGIEAEAPSDK